MAYRQVVGDAPSRIEKQRFARREKDRGVLYGMTDGGSELCWVRTSDLCPVKAAL